MNECEGNEVAVFETPICSRCQEPLRLSPSALKYVQKLAKDARPATCAKCAVDNPGSGKSATKV
jgi:hypothetical protein